MRNALILIPFIKRSDTIRNLFVDGIDIFVIKMFHNIQKACILGYMFSLASDNFELVQKSERFTCGKTIVKLSEKSVI